MNKDILIIVDVSVSCRRVNRCMHIHVLMEDRSVASVCLGSVGLAGSLGEREAGR